MLQRFLLPFEFLSKREESHQAVNQVCYGPEGEGGKLDEKIAKLANLPEIFAQGKAEYQENLAKIKKTKKKKLFEICGMLAHGLHGLSDCHHSTYRWLEKWLHAIGTFSTEIPSRHPGSEGKRIGRLLFAYALGLDLWLQGISNAICLAGSWTCQSGF